ncbi:MAG: Survival protein SurA precursor (Peptidyl-prolyl cis-trans isomerase SurA) [uncultured Segetibacter sp.]|uniref:Survival protein SurA (Peptidyl-prolyl cis-trans isomerase SurA) n=1 Tax=uncultured Segetibacter sp. TaxID=481133 RepID=A0A6J4TFR2_9BACT|nr:MAG: Survival protein SurA precursor (Peptidyl-prolyl cis-trans isomerase SurA) [uncultured Segetibacter sp.]
MKITSFLFVFALGISASSYAQPKKVVADKIVAQVGDKIILRSDIYNSIQDAQRQGATLPPNPECVLVERALIEKALVLQAEKDSLPVSDEELEASLDNQIRGFVMQYGSKEVLEEVAGKSVFQLKEDFRQPFRERMQADQMRKKIIENVKMTPNEVRAHYDLIPKDSLPFYESELEVSEIVVYPKANREVESYVTRELNDWKKQVEDGSKKFDQLAKSYTEDPGSKESGGQYNINRNDKIWDPAFLSAAFKLKEGQVSQVVKSKFGLHIIQMVSRSGDDAVIRHILRIPPVTDAEVKESIDLLDSVRSRLISGKIGFGEAVNRYSEDEASKFSGGRRQGRDGSSFVTIDQLDKDMVLAIQKLKVGEYSQPIPFADERGKKAVRLVYLQTRTEPHRENLKDDYSKISQRALEDKRNGVLEKWFQSHIPTYYITIDKDFSGCENVKEWTSNTVANN